jgi:hypothetical protein
MKAHLDAVKARLSPTAATHLIWATGAHPYYVLTSTGADLSDEDNVATQRDTLDALVRVKAVTGTADGVLKMLDLARAELSPGMDSSPLVVAGRSATIRFVRSEFVDVDEDVTLTATDRHPFVGVDTYRIVSQPV